MAANLFLNESYYSLSTETIFSPIDWVIELILTSIVAILAWMI